MVATAPDAPDDDPWSTLMLNRQLYQFSLEPGTNAQVIQSAIERHSLTNHIVWILRKRPPALSFTHKYSRI